MRHRTEADLTEARMSVKAKLFRFDDPASRGTGRHLFQIKEGVPTDTEAGYHKGALAFDITNGDTRQNTGTAASAIWKKLRLQSSASSSPLNFGDDDNLAMQWDGSNFTVIPLTDDTGAFIIGNGTKDMDLKIFLGTAAKYFLCDVGNSRVVSTVEVESQRGRHAQTWMEMFDDFVGDAGKVLNPAWSKDLQASATGDFISAADGVFRILTSSASEAQAGQVTSGDVLWVNLSKKPIIEFRVRMAPAGAALTADERFFIGLFPAHANSEDSLDDGTGSSGFRMEGADLKIYVEADDGTNDTDDQDSTITYTKSAWTIFTIDWSVLTAPTFQVDGVEQGGSAVSVAVMGANVMVQPIVCHQRDAGTEVNSIDIDYIKVTQERS